MFDFEQFAKQIEEKAMDSEQIKINNVSEVFHIAFFQIPIENIDFNSFSSGDCLLAMDIHLDEIFSRETADYDEEIVYTDNHPFHALREAEALLTDLNNSRKINAPSRYKFL